MARGNPKISEYGEKTRFNGCSSVEASEKAVKVRQELKTYRRCFRDRMTHEDMCALFDMLLKRAKQGNLRAFEILRDTMGENPNKVKHIDVKIEDDGLIEALQGMGKNHIVEDLPVE